MSDDQSLPSPPAIVPATAGDEPPAEEEFPWGGDGSDPTEPIREHVAAALVVVDEPYTAPVDRLRRLGSLHELEDPDATIAALGLTQADAPALVRMARDRALHTADPAAPDSWAPIHALIALKQLDVAPFVEELIPLFDIDVDWVSEELPEVLAPAGAVVIEPITRYVQDRSRYTWGRIFALNTFPKLAERFPELRDRLVQILDTQMERAAEEIPEFNGSLLADLLELRAVEALPAIRRAFEADAIDESIVGGWGEVLDDLGIEPDPDDPLLKRSRERREQRHAEMGFYQRPAAPPKSAIAPAAPKKSGSSKRKNKRKMAESSRKTNKQKKKKKR